jgi:hypothetical protein
LTILPGLCGDIGLRGESKFTATHLNSDDGDTLKLLLAFSSDKFKERGLHITAASGLAGLMYALSIGVKNKSAQYVFLWCVCHYHRVLPTEERQFWSGWYMECFTGYSRLGTECCILSKRKTSRRSSICEHGYRSTNQKYTNSFLVFSTVANLSSIYGAYLWPANDAPRYVMGLSTTSAMCFACSISALAALYFTAKYPYSFDFDKWGVVEKETEEVISNDSQKSSA